MTTCSEPGCGGHILDGFCDRCGLAPAESGAAATAGLSVARAESSSVGLSIVRSAATIRAVPRGTSRSSRTGRTARSSRGHLGAGLVAMPRVPYRDPASAVMANPEVAEHQRFCNSCDKPVGRANGVLPGRTEGFCRHCGSAFSFTPKLLAGDMVASQYEVLGCLAHGGLGWVYLAKDHNVSDRWVVLKGLLDSGDADAMAAAVAERQFLAAVEHPNIVKIYNFVEHPDPKTGAPVGYIVMEYVGGNSLKELRSRTDASGRLEPLPLAQGLAYILEILPALGYLHGSDLLYCDFKPDNVIQTEEQLKLIDLGAVRHLDDRDSAGYKTDGYCAPELAADGPSIESDLFTIGRTLAVLTMNFDFRGRYRYALPDPADMPLLARFPSFHRLLARATDADPTLRFHSASELAEQLTGVLREVVAIAEGTPKPAASKVFGPERATFGAAPDDWPAPPTPPALVTALPVPLVDARDPVAGMLAAVTVSDPRLLAAALATAPSSVEVTLALIRAHIEAGEFDCATAALDGLAETDDADWRVTWYRGLAALAAGDAAAARLAFDVVYSVLPGEDAAKLALAVACESAGDAPAALWLYRAVWSTDHGYPSAAFGASRMLLAVGDIAGAVELAESVPASSSHHLAAQLVAIRCRIADGIADPQAVTYLIEAGERSSALELDVAHRARMNIRVLEAARALVARGRHTTGATVLGCGLDDRSVRRGLEREYRTLARVTTDKMARRHWIDRANAVRPVTWI